MKSFVALLIIGSLAMTAYSQCSSATVAAGIFNSSYPTAITAAVATACLSCSSGYLLQGNSGSCTACGSNCAWCYNSSYCLACNMGYALNSSVSTGPACVACTGCTACNITSGTLTCSACMTGYALTTSGTCVTCVSAGSGTAAAPYGIAGCATCGAAITVNSLQFLTCTSCLSTYVLIAKDGTVATVAFCQTITSAATAIADPLHASSASTIGTSTATIPTNCLQATITFSTTTANSFICNAAAATYWCLAAATAACTLNTATVTTLVSTATAYPTGCTGGVYTSSAFGLCSTCTATTYQLVPSSVYGTGVCALVVTGCAVYSSSTGACTAAGQGWNLPTSGTPAACAAGATCSSGVCSGNGGGSGLTLNITGTCFTNPSGYSGIPTNCLVANSTMGCAVCWSGFTNGVTSFGSCGGCPSNCAVCSSTTTCVACSSSTYTISAGACTAKPAASSSAKALFAGLAFISMIFYYIF